MSGDDSSNLAVLIDADNVSSKVIAGLMAEVANYGNASVRRIYGDWTSPSMKSWRQVLLEHSVAPIQQFAYTTGKNATDGAMIIDAMDLMYTGRFSGFCIVSSDSDFTRLASRIREQGITVYGFGERKTNNAFIVACNKFVYFDALPVPAGDVDEPEQPTAPPEAISGALNSDTRQQPPDRNDPTRANLRGPPRPSVASSYQYRIPGPEYRPRPRPLDGAALTALKSAIEASNPYEGDFVNLADVGKILHRISPDLTPRNYGYLRLFDFVEASGIVDVEMRSHPSRPPIAVVRLKAPSTANQSDEMRY